MPTTTIPWGDGSGDNLYLTYPSASGDQSVSVTSDANTGGARSKVVTFSAVGVTPVTLTISQDAGGGGQEYSVTKYPSSYDTENSAFRSWGSSHGADKGYTSANSTTYAVAYMVRGSRAESVLYWQFDLAEIPDNAVIKSVTLVAKARKTGNTSQVASTYLAVCNGTTEVGSHSAVTSSTAAQFTLDTGSGWTGASIKNLTIKHYGVRGTSGVNQDYSLDFYGATLTITYEA